MKFTVDTTNIWLHAVLVSCCLLMPVCLLVFMTPEPLQYPEEIGLAQEELFMRYATGSGNFSFDTSRLMKPRTFPECADTQQLRMCSTVHLNNTGGTKCVQRFAHASSLWYFVFNPDAERGPSMRLCAWGWDNAVGKSLTQARGPKKH